jgi:hypothetical protein
MNELIHCYEYVYTLLKLKCGIYVCESKEQVVTLRAHGIFRLIKKPLSPTLS